MILLVQVLSAEIVGAGSASSPVSGVGVGGGAGSTQDVEPEAAAAIGPLVVLLGEDIPTSRMSESRSGKTLATVRPDERLAVLRAVMRT